MKGNVLIVILCLASNICFGQCTGWNWPDDKETAVEKNVLYNDALISSNFRAAIKPHRWLLQNAPKLNSSIYINGVKIFAALADSETDETKKQEWVDSLMMMYDMRIAHCGEEAKVSQRKAFDAYKYKIRDKDELPGLLELFDKTFEQNGKDIGYYIILPYMRVVYYNAINFNNLSEEEVMKRYDKMIEIIENKIKEGQNVPALEEIKPEIEDLLVKIVNVDCDFVKSNLGPKFKDNPHDLGLAKKIFGFILAGKCTDEPLWLESAILIQEKEPTYGLGKNIAIKCMVKGDNVCADKYLDEAVALTDDPSNKAEIFMIKGDLKEKQGSLSEARSQYYKALEATPGNSEAYRKIGLLYFNSFSSCQEFKDPIIDRLVFMAAYDMFKKTGDNGLMESAKEQFPSKDDIFQWDYRRGQTLNTGCWMKEDVILRARDE